VIRTYPVFNALQKVPMAASNEDVMKELTRLRTEIQQLREVVNALFNAVFEESEEEWDSTPDKDEFNLYN
jgi:tetrahydromethanopterin S-methyltransferase subunit B